MAKKDYRFGISGSVQGIDLNQLLVPHQASTYFMRLENDILELELHAGDVLIVDRSLLPKANDIVVVEESDSPQLKVVRFHPKSELIMFGVITSVIRSLHS